MDADTEHVETWRINQNWGTAIDLSGCQAGKTTDARCDELHCQFRTRRREAPKTEMKTLALLCPRNKEYVEEDLCIGAPLV